MALATAVAVSAATPGKKTLRIASPAAGHYSVEAFRIAARAKPRLHIVGTVPKSLVVIVAVAADKKTKGRYYAFVVQLHRKSTAQRFGPVEATVPSPPPNVALQFPEGELPVNWARRKAVRAAVPLPNYDIEEVRNLPAGFTDRQILKAAIEDNLDGILDPLLVGSSPPPVPTAFGCTVRTQRDAGFPNNEWNIFGTCNQQVAAATITFAPGLTVTAWLPSSCNGSGNVLMCPTLNFPPSSPFELDARFSGAFPPSSPFTAHFTSGTGAVVDVTGTGP